jgi:isoleucyl-tRNA synthetase
VFFKFKGGEKMNYKDTLLMPETSFQMRGNLPENEKIQREKWEEMMKYL